LLTACNAGQVDEDADWHCAMHPDPRIGDCDLPAQALPGDDICFEKVPGYISKDRQPGQASGQPGRASGQPGQASRQPGQAGNLEYFQAIAHQHLKPDDHKHVLSWLTKFTDAQLEQGIKASLPFAEDCAQGKAALHLRGMRQHPCMLFCSA
jgi:hypothetical protein